MDNGWELLSPKEELRRQRIDKVIWRFIKFVYFPIWLATITAFALTM